MEEVYVPFVSRIMSGIDGTKNNSATKAVFAFAREFHSKKVNQKPISYGTAGFRTHADNLEYVMYRMGLLAALRSRSQYGRVIGVMITASHNPECDNGVKLVDPMGEMLAPHWEKLATQLVNVSDNDLEAEVEKIIKEENIDVNEKAYVYVGMDTRYHSPVLCRAVVNGVLALKGNVKEYGIVTTPMLHYFVVCANTKQSYGIATEEGYYSKIVGAFKQLRGKDYNNGNYVNKVVYDGANGVGSLKMLQFIKKFNGCLEVQVVNSNGKINYECGADFVKVQQKPPNGLPNDLPPFTRCVSVDGDADRVIYFFVDDKEKFHMLDGDRIATLVAGYLMDLVKACGIDLKLGLVQTAYANGASTDYIQNVLQVPVACVPTGVKHLHHKALEYDIGVYFEANGHGTIVFNNYAKTEIFNAAKNLDVANGLSIDQKTAARKLLNTIDLINETVGDAISDMLLVETVLHSKGWDLSQWLETYTDLPNLQLKVCVEDRNVITTADAERICVTPEGLQAEIDRLVAKYSKGRSFVRPSGTEDVVRVYAEAATKEETQKLGAEVALAVFNMAGGVGKAPVVPE